MPGSRWPRRLRLGPLTIKSFMIFGTWGNVVISHRKVTNLLGVGMTVGGVFCSLRAVVSYARLNRSRLTFSDEDMIWSLVMFKK